VTGAGGELPTIIAESAASTEETVDALRESIMGVLGGDAPAVIGDHTTFILTGSGGRGEMTEGSDIDGYVVRVHGEPDPEHDQLLLAATRAALEELKLPELDRGGEFLAMTTASSLVDCLGSADDDHTNALTTRMLFLLEGRPLVGEGAFRALSKHVQNTYRSTAKEHADDFLPFFLVNDIIRYWRTVLLNHEDRLRQKRAELAKHGLSGDALDETVLAHRKYRSQKLRFPRCLTCFSALAYVLAMAPTDDDSISESDEQEMFDLTPMERMQRIAETRSHAKERVEAMIEMYAGYLARSSGEKAELIERLLKDDPFARETSSEGLRFTEEMFHLIQELGNGSRLHRQMLI
jgi:hypothetical protein